MANPVSRAFSRLGQVATVATGSAFAFAIAITTIVIWAALGPTFHYSDTWQLVINTGTTIVTFLMVFVIQHAQNKEMRSIQIKLDELVASAEGASNLLIDVEELSDEEVDDLYQRYHTLAGEAARHPAGARLSVEEAQAIAARARDAAAVARAIAAHSRHRAKSKRP